MPGSGTPLPDYVLVTPARNEEDFIEKTIQSVIAQTHLPLKWVIISDGSTDQTDAIVEKYLPEHPFMELVKASHQGHQEGFGSKVKAVWAGVEKMAGLDYAFIGNLDADVSFEPDYFEKLLAVFLREPDLGLAGGLILELVHGQFLSRNTNLKSVAGAVQLFRRACWEDIGGYMPFSIGGEDAAAETMARMKGWEVHTVPDLGVRHHRLVLTGKRTILGARFNKGAMNHLLGYHPLFQLALCGRRAFSRPYVLGSIWMLTGYLWAKARRLPRPVPQDFVAYIQEEQLRRLKIKKRKT